MYTFFAPGRPGGLAEEQVVVRLSLWKVILPTGYSLLETIHVVNIYVDYTKIST